MIFTFVLDLKVTPENKVKILEVQQTLQSGATGYEELYGKCMIRDVIMPFYKQEFGIPVFNQDPRATRKYIHKGPHGFSVLGWHDSVSAYENAVKLPSKKNFKPDLISTYSAIVSPFYFENCYSKHVECEQQERVLVVNDNRVFCAVTMNKFLQSRYFTPFIGDLAPQEVSVLKGDPSHMAREIKSAIASDYIILKKPESSRAKGVVPVKRDMLEDVLAVLFPEDKRSRGRKVSDARLSEFFNHRSFKYGEWAAQPVIVAQSCEVSKPVLNPQDGQLYDPTMRVFVSVWDDAGQTKCHVHDGYWKLPSKALSDNLSAQSIISTSPAKSGPVAVTKEDMGIVKAQLKKGLPGVFQRIQSMNTVTLLRDFACDRSDASLLAFERYMLLTHAGDTLAEAPYKDIKIYAEALVDMEIRHKKFIVHNTKTKQASFLIPGQLEGRESHEKWKYLASCYVKAIDARRHLLPKEHVLYRAPN